MHLAARAYQLLVLAAVLAIIGIWTHDAAFADLWMWPLALLLTGVAAEAWFAQRTRVGLTVQVEPRLYLGRRHEAAFVFENASSRPVRMQYAPATPAAVETLGAPRALTTEARSRVRQRFAMYPVRLGLHAWPPVPARLRGRFGFIWWTRSLDVRLRIAVAPDTRRTTAPRPRGIAAGERARRVAGAGSELHQLRAYVRGDPLARIDWKATARARRLVTREFTEDQHLDVVVALDAGRLSRIRAGRLDRLGLYANLAARFGEEVTANDDRIGLVVYADRPIAVCAPDRGARAVARLRRALETMSAESAESDPLAAAARIRALLRHRSLVVVLTDLDDATSTEQLTRAVRLLTPLHLVVAAAARNTEVEELASRKAADWRDPWIALAAEEHGARTRAQLAVLKRLGVPVVAARDALLERAVFLEYERLRRARRI